MDKLDRTKILLLLSFVEIIPYLSAFFPPA
jgi:hypothetical protein